MNEIEKGDLKPLVEVDTRTGCWNWNRAVGKSGYGVVRVGKRSAVSAHRVAWETANEKQIPVDMCVLHRCDNKRCVNPDHLVLGTPQDNTLDSLAKGRKRTGTRMANHKLEISDLKIIRTSHRSTNQLAAEFGVCWKTIDRVRRGLAYRNDAR